MTCSQVLSKRKMSWLCARVALTRVNVVAVRISTMSPSTLKTTKKQMEMKLVLVKTNLMD